MVSRKRHAIQALLKSYAVTPSLSVFVGYVSQHVMNAAVEWGDSHVFEQLLLHGCGFYGHEVSLKRYFDVEQEDERGRSFLLRLCDLRSRAAGRLVARLLKEQPNIDAVDNDGNTALHLAAMRESAAVTHALVRSYADVSPANHDGVTPLHIAFANCSRRIAVMLIKDGGAVVDAQDDLGALVRPLCGWPRMPWAQADCAGVQAVPRCRCALPHELQRSASAKSSLLASRVPGIASFRRGTRFPATVSWWRRA